MKLEQHVTLTDPEAFLRGDYYSCFTLTSNDSKVPGWFDCGIIEIDIDLDTNKLIESVSGTLDREIKENYAVISVLEARKAELLALEYDGGNE